jgi:pimeloyl-ACP methyl ester carboxylesterase
VVNTILWEALTDVILVGHSYGGMVITGVADRIPERIRQLVYLDAFLPDSGESLADIRPEAVAGLLASNTHDGMVIPPWVTADQPVPRDVPHPLRTFNDTLHLRNPARTRVPAAYILTVEPDQPVDNFQTFADRARARGWDVRQLTADHVPERSAPEPLVDMLLSLGPALETDSSRSGAMFDELARMDSILFDAAFVSCNNHRVDSILARDIEFVHDKTGFKSGDTVRDDFTRLTGNCPRRQGVRRELVGGSLQVFPIHDYGAVQMGTHRFIEQGQSSITVAKFVHLWQRRPDGHWRLTRVLSFDHRPGVRE